MNAMTKAIQNIRKKKMGSVADFMDPEMQDLAMEEGDLANADAENQTSLAPSLKGKNPQVDIDIEVEGGDEEGMGMPGREEEMMVQDMGGDQGDAIDRKALLESMYSEGDENRKGFMGKAASKIKEGLAKVRG